MYKILVVDDEVAFLNTMAEILELEGYEVILGSDGRTALKYIRAHQPHLVITDILMPGMSGLELLSLSKADDITRNTPFILLSGDISKHTLVDAQNNGAWSVMYKPFDILKFLSTVEACLSTVLHLFNNG